MNYLRPSTAARQKIEDVDGEHQYRLSSLAKRLLVHFLCAGDDVIVAGLWHNNNNDISGRRNTLNDQWCFKLRFKVKKQHVEWPYKRIDTLVCAVMLCSYLNLYDRSGCSCSLPPLLSLPRAQCIMVYIARLLTIGCALLFTMYSEKQGFSSLNNRTPLQNGNILISEWCRTQTVI